jgi:DNA polymerase-3 subunit gamma/tau
MSGELKRHEPLYLKHRPQSLDELVGQTAVTGTLTNAITHDRISHAYLFTGPRGTGKTSSARILAKSLNCKSFDKPTVSPCQTCTSCLEIKNGTSPAVFEIDAASNNSVDDARVLIERAPLVAPGARFKIYIIDECHMLTKEAFNALLKTIEDPPPNVIFVLATTEEHKVLPTIVSRCQRLMFRLVTQEDLSKHLRAVAQKEQIDISDEALDFIARRSGGGLRDALGLLDQASLLSAPGKPAGINDLLGLLGALHEDSLLEMSEFILHRQGQSILALASRLLQEGREPAVLIQELARHFLNLMKASYLSEESESLKNLITGSPAYSQGLVQQAPQFDRSELSLMVEALDRLEQTCRRTTQPAMHLEVGLLALCHRSDMALVRDLADRVAALESAVQTGTPLRPGDASKVPPQSTIAAKPQPRPAVQPAQAPVTVPATPAPKTDPIPPAREPVSPSQPEPVPSATPSEPVPASPAREPVSSTTPSEPVSSAPAEQVSASPAKPGEPENCRGDACDGAAASLHFAPSPLAGHRPGSTDEISASPTPEPVSAAPAEPVPATPAPAPASAAPQPNGSDSEENNVVAADELDHVWSQTLEELQRRHIPTFSLASTHAFPVMLTAKELTLGVTNETLQRSLEPKSIHLNAACQAVLGRDVHVRIKVLTRDSQGARSSDSAGKQTATRATAKGSSSGASVKTAPADDDSDYEPAPPGLGLSVSIAPPAPPTALPPQNMQSAAPARESSISQQEFGQSSQTTRSAVGLAEKSSTPTQSEAGAPSRSAQVELKAEAAAVNRVKAAAQSKPLNAGMIKEAYRLFEGPGSRLITPPDHSA